MSFASLRKRALIAAAGTAVAVVLPVAGASLPAAQATTVATATTATTSATTTSTTSALTPAQMLDSAIVRLQQAITIAGGLTGAEATRIVNTARVALARAYLQKGDNANAATTAALVPAAFVAALLGLLAISPWTVWPLAAVLAAYTAYVGAASVLAAQAAGQWRTLTRLPMVIAAYHVAYGLGTWRGLWDVARHQAPSAQFARITR